MRKERRVETVECTPEEISLKSFFLGPQSENGKWLKAEVSSLIDHFLDWRRSLFPKDGRAISTSDQNNFQSRQKQKKLSRSLLELMKALEDETPTFTPRYVGHMVSEVSMPAMLGHIVMLLHNPNNASKEVSKIGLRIEREAIQWLCEMVGFDPKHCQGHFTSGGTLANFEGLWRARYRMDHFLALGLLLKQRKRSKKSLFELSHVGWEEFRRSLKKEGLQEDAFRQFSLVANNPFRVAREIKKVFGLDYDGAVLLVPGSKHYSWQKGNSLFGMGDESFRSIALDKFGRLDLTDLRKQILKAKGENRPIVSVVSIAGTTELGEMDPVHEVQDLLDTLREQDGIHIWHHVDAAYGGFYCSVLDSKPQFSKLDPNALEALRALKRVDSITIDPHKLGYVPYACGAILVPNSENYTVSSFAAPYLNLSPKERGGWSSTIEGSRSASGASAMWLSAKAIGLNSDGYGRILIKGIESRRRLEEELEKNVPGIFVVKPTDLNVLCFAAAREGEPTEKTNRRTLKLYSKLMAGPEFAVSKTRLATSDYEKLVLRQIARWQGVLNTNDLVLVRMVLMNPFISSKEIRVDFIREFCRVVQNYLSEIR